MAHFKAEIALPCGTGSRDILALCPPVKHVTPHDCAPGQNLHLTQSLIRACYTVVPAVHYTSVALLVRMYRLSNAPQALIPLEDFPDIFVATQERQESEIQLCHATIHNTGSANVSQ